MDVRKAYVDTPKGQVHYLTTGTGAPSRNRPISAIVLLHQTSDASTMWLPVLPLLGEMGYHAVAIDMPGHGNSDAPPEQPDAAEFARRVDEVAQLLELGRYHIFGHHFGATIAAWVAANHAEHVGKLLLYGWPALDPAWRKKMQQASDRPFSKDGEDIKKYWMSRWETSDMGLPDGASSGFTADTARRTETARLQTGPTWYYAYHAMGFTDHAELAGRISCPTLLFAGPRDHMWEESESAVQDFSNARFENVPGAGLDISDEMPEEFCRIVDTFLRED